MVELNEMRGCESHHHLRKHAGACMSLHCTIGADADAFNPPYGCRQSSFGCSTSRLVVLPRRPSAFSIPCRLGLAGRMLLRGQLLLPLPPPATDEPNHDKRQQHHASHACGRHCGSVVTRHTLQLI